MDQGNTVFSKLDYTGAILWYSRLLKEYPDDKLAVTAAFLRGVSQYQAGQASTALDSSQKLDRTWPLNDFRNRLPYWKGVSALGAGLLGVAERELTAQARLTEAQPWATRALFHLGLTRLMWPRK